MKLLTWPKPKGLLEEGPADLAISDLQVQVIDILESEYWIRYALNPSGAIAVIDYMTREELEKRHPSARIAVRTDDDFWREP